MIRVSKSSTPQQLLQQRAYHLKYRQSHPLKPEQKLKKRQNEAARRQALRGKPSLITQPAVVYSVSLDDLKKRFVFSEKTCLGEGKNGTVHCAKDLQNGRDIAVKLFYVPEKQRSSRRLKQIESKPFNELVRYQATREFNVMKAFNHPHILRCHELFYIVCSEPAAAITMPIIAGKSVEAIFMTENGTRLTSFWTFVQQTASAMSYIHSLGFVHRDIAPRNIMYADNHATIIDLGYARTIEPGKNGCNLKEPQLQVDRLRVDELTFAPETTNWKGDRVLIPNEDILQLYLTDVWDLCVVFWLVLEWQLEPAQYELFRATILAQNKERWTANQVLSFANRQLLDQHHL